MSYAIEPRWAKITKLIKHALASKEVVQQAKSSEDTTILEPERLELSLEASSVPASHPRKLGITPVGHAFS